MMKGFLKSNEDEAPSLALTLANHKHGHEDRDKNLISCNRNQDQGCKTMGFHSLFQSLYCPKTKAQETVALNANTQTEGSKEHGLDNKICDSNGTPIACRMVTDNVYKRFLQPNEKLNESTSGNGAAPPALIKLLSTKIASGQEISGSNSAEKKNSCNMATDKEKDGTSSNSSPGKRKSLAFNKRDDAEQPSEGKATNTSGYKRDPLTSLWITRLSPKTSGPLSNRDLCHGRTGEALDGLTDFIRLKAPWQNHPSSYRDKKKKLWGLGRRSTSLRTRFRNSEAMASVFARRLDALKHIMPSYGTDDSSHGNLTYVSSQITGLLRACPSASSRTRHQAEYGDSQVRESSPCKILLNPRNEDDAKRSDGKDSQLQAADAPTVRNGKLHEASASGKMNMNMKPLKPPLIFNKMQLDNNNGHAILTRVLAASFLGFISAAAATLYYRRKSEAKIDHHIIPGLVRTESGRLGNLERFSDYVARQMGFADADECPRLCKLAYDYLKRSEGCENNIYDFFANLSEFESLYVKLMEEFEKCILTYFAFHWSRASLFISQVIDVESVKKPKLKGIVMAATRKQRFERVTKNLKVTRAFSTLVEELKAIGQGESHCTEVMVPVALSERSPVLLLMGGGMGAGKSTVTKDILKEPFWSGAKAKAVVVEADAFKESDVIYRAISSMGHHDDMLQTAEL
ncbi:hypothetical protein D5086_016859, partial [Populus alba]